LEQTRLSGDDGRDICPGSNRVTDLKYSFGDTDAARQRLDLLSSIFDPPSRAFLAVAVGRRPRLAVDLGCGPGNTTRMVSAVTGAQRTVGLDRSAAFVAEASARGGAGLGFAVWEAASRLPCDQIDLIYARLLLAHLASPADHLARWAPSLSPGGQLLLDELEAIETGNDVLAEYLAIVTALVRANGAEMFAGPVLARLREPEGCVLARSEVVELPVAPAAAARMFRLNLEVWRTDEWVRGSYGSAAIAALAGRLDTLAGAGSRAGITWKMRQVVIERTHCAVTRGDVPGARARPRSR
jgi:trans-aconitate 2-methyltransferase